MMTTHDLIKQAIDHVGYGHESNYTANELIECFLDLVDCGCWKNLDSDEVTDMLESNELSVMQICKILLKL